MVTERPTILESWSGKKLGFFQVGSARGAQRVAPPPMVVVRLPPSKMRAESKGVRAGSEVGLLCASIREHFLYAVPSPYAFLGMSEIIRPESRPILLGV